MQVVELAGVILALSMEVLVGVILTQSLKATSKEKMARSGSHRLIVARKLRYLARPTHLGMSAPTSKAERCRG